MHKKLRIYNFVFKFYVMSNNINNIIITIVFESFKGSRKKVIFLVARTFLVLKKLK